ncbi:MAG: tRNA pseudouridine(55) synthase TruB [Elusimicrobiota bacterium]
MKNVLLINKPSGITSYDVIRILKKKLQPRPKKTGHTGTLDPLASGLLIVLVDDATKDAEKFLALDKQYLVKMQLGVQTDTGDTDGKIVKTCTVPKLTRKKIERVLKKFEGKIKQIPPMYSAIKYKGRKLYEYARAGIKIKIKPRVVEIKKIKLLKYTKETIKLRVDCSKGTYIRKLVEDIAEKLNTCAVVTKLVRTKIGKYSLKKAINVIPQRTQSFKFLILFFSLCPLW